jgi:phosphate transport system permease protein
MKEASLALGASHWQTIYKVVIPYSASGITAGAILGRAIGETIAVLMVTGNAAVSIPFSTC